MPAHLHPHSDPPFLPQTSCCSTIPDYNTSCCVCSTVQSGKLPLKKTAAEQPAAKPSTATPATSRGLGDNKEGVTAAQGLSQKQPSKIRLKQTPKPHLTASASPSPLQGAAATTSTAEPAAAVAAADKPPAVKQEQPPSAGEPVAAATISKEALAAALAQRLAQQRRQLPQATAAAAAAEEAAAPGSAGDADLHSTAPVRSFREAHKARVQGLAAPRTPTGSAAAGGSMSEGPQSVVEQHQQQPAAAAATSRYVLS